MLRSFRPRSSALMLTFVGLGMVVPTACKRSSEPVVLVAAADVSLPVTNKTDDAISGLTFIFPGGAGALSPSVAGQTLALTFTAPEGSTAVTATANFTSSTGAATGSFTSTVTYGSCDFLITDSTFPAGSALAKGQKIVVNPCNINVGTKGVVANGVAVNRSVALRLGAAVSAGQSISIAVNAGGELTINGRSVGTVELTPISS